MTQKRDRIGVATRTRVDGSIRVRELVESLNLTFEDSSFVAGDSPIVLDYLGARGYNAVNSWVVCDGPGDILVAYSRDGSEYGQNWRLKVGEMLNLTSFDVATIKITHSGDDSGYRAFMV